MIPRVLLVVCFTARNCPKLFWVNGIYGVPKKGVLLVLDANGIRMLTNANFYDS